MSQPSTITIPGSPLGGGAAVTNLQDTINALASGHKGASRPPYVLENMIWTKEVSATAWEVYLYDGAADILLYVINPTTNNYAAKLITKSATFALAVTDRDKFFYCTASADYDITFAAVATLTDAFHCVIKNDSAYTLTLNPDGSENINGATTLALPAGRSAFVFNSGTALFAIVVGGSSSSARVCEARLTLESGVAVSITDQTAKTTVYFTPHKGNSIALYDGSNWADHTLAEISVAAPATTDTPFDVFVYDNAGTLTLETVDWTNDTTRATAIVLQDGVYVKSGATTRRYLGTGRTTGVSGQTEDSAGTRYLWNYYNRVKKQLEYYPTTSSWTDAATYTWRQWNADANMLVEFIIGVSEDIVAAEAKAIGSSTVVNSLIGTAIGEDSTTSASQNAVFGACQVPTSAVLNEVSASYKNILSAGRHYLALLERAGGGTTTTWRGQAGDAQSYHAGINGEILC